MAITNNNCQFNTQIKTVNGMYKASIRTRENMTILKSLIKENAPRLPWPYEKYSHNERNNFVAGNRN